MNKRQKEVAQATLDNEKEVLKKLEDNYIKALAEIKKNIRELQAMPDTQSKAYRIEFQKQLEKQISAYLEVLKGNNFKQSMNICKNAMKKVLSVRFTIFRASVKG